MVDIQYPLAEKEKKKKKDRTTGQKYNGLPYYIGRPYKNQATTLLFGSEFSLWSYACCTFLGDELCL